MVWSLFENAGAALSVLLITGISWASAGSCSLSLGGAANCQNYHRISDSNGTIVAGYNSGSAHVGLFLYCTEFMFTKKYVSIRVVEASFPCSVGCAAVQAFPNDLSLCEEKLKELDGRMIFGSNKATIRIEWWSQKGLGQGSLVDGESWGFTLEYAQSDDGESCPAGWAWCGGVGKCLPNKLTCDGTADCEGGQDEMPTLCGTHTSPSTCSSRGLYSCVTSAKSEEAAWGVTGLSSQELPGTCYSRSQRCDSVRQCHGGVDERYCTHCPGFRCSADEPFSGGLCFPSSSRCDGRAQCSDGSDEHGCTTTTTTTTIPPFSDHVVTMPCKHTYISDQGIISMTSAITDISAYLPCTWRFRSARDSIIYIRFTSFSMSPNIHLNVTNVMDDGKILAYYSLGDEPAMDGTWGVFLTSLVKVGLFWKSSDPRVTPPPPLHFNFTMEYRTVASCLADELHCNHGDRACYRQEQKCDGERWCPSGGDEMGCGSTCGKEEFLCKGSKGSDKCYSASQQCDGYAICPEKDDEKNCQNSGCGAPNGTYLCSDNLCIRQNWLCDGGNDCSDGSDEVDCNEGASTRVVLAAVVGSLICGILVVIAAGCTCKLLAFRLQDRMGDSRYTSPMTAMQNEFNHRRAPPSYTEAMETSRPFDEVHREFLAHVERARSLRDAAASAEEGGEPPAADSEMSVRQDTTVAAFEAALRRHQHRLARARRSHRQRHGHYQRLEGSPEDRLRESSRIPGIRNDFDAALYGLNHNTMSSSEGLAADNLLSSSAPSGPPILAHSSSIRGSIFNGELSNGQNAEVFPAPVASPLAAALQSHPSSDSLEAVSIVVGLSAQYRRSRGSPGGTYPESPLVHSPRVSSDLDPLSAGPVTEHVSGEGRPKRTTSSRRRLRVADIDLPSAIETVLAQGSSSMVGNEESSMLTNELPHEEGRHDSLDDKHRGIHKTLAIESEGERRNGNTKVEIGATTSSDIDGKDEDKVGASSELSPTDSSPPDGMSRDFDEEDDEEEDGSVAGVSRSSDGERGNSTGGGRSSRSTLRRRFSIESESCLSFGDDSVMSDDVPLLR